MSFLSWLFGSHRKPSVGGQAGRYGTPIPLSTFDGWVKQIQPEMLEERSRAFLELAFPGFTEELGEVNPRILTPLQEFSAGRLRRYAGSIQAPPGRYFTIAQHSGGDDGGTLVAELLAYWNERSRLAAWITDPSVPGHGDETVRAHVRAQFGAQPCLCISIAEVVGFHHGTVNLGTEFVLIIPIFVAPIHATSVLDLRIPQAQDWFCSTFGALESRPRRFSTWIKQRPDSFRDMIPTLLHPARGGLAFHHAVGAWLGANGVSTLIYPSARRDSRVTFQDQKLVSHDGWNLVALGGLNTEALRAGGSDQFGFLGKWLSSGDALMGLDWSENHQGRTWRVSGISSRESQRLRSLMMEMIQEESGKSGWLRNLLQELGFDVQSQPSRPSRWISARDLFHG